MNRSRLLVAISMVLVVFASAVADDDKKKKAAGHEKIPAALWRDPGDIASRDLFYGPGSKDRAPAPPFRFIKEDKDGESPKIKVKDSRGVEWQVKLGPEAQAETVATRLVWAVGYFAEEAYYLDRAKIDGLPEKLSRGKEYIVSGNTLIGARFEPRRNNMERVDSWDWSKNPFAGTEMLDGLKVLMILLNNYDAREANNRVVLVKNGGEVEARYIVTDIGATLGKADGLGGHRSKNDLEDYLSTRFVLGVKKGVVEFDYDTRPTKFGVVSILNPDYYIGEVKKEKDMRGIPVEHARWIGRLLSELTDDQLRDAFRAANYDSRTAEGFVAAIRQRINQLARL